MPLRHATATANPVAITQFFHHTYKGIFDSLLGSNTGRVGILGQVANHFRAVKINGRGILHLHALVWLRGNLEFATLRDRVLRDKPFALRIVQYLESVVVHSIDLDSTRRPNIKPALASPSSKGAEANNKFHSRLSIDSNLVARRKQIYSSNHTATCFKYSRKGQGPENYRFRMPRELRPDSKVDKLGVIHLARNHS